MFRRLFVLFAILLQIIVVSSGHVTIAAPAIKCKVASDCPKLGHDHVECVKEKCVTIQTPH